jgi:hypothetical protein
MPGWATQWGLWARGWRRPRGQPRRARARCWRSRGGTGRARCRWRWAKRGSRTVKYCAPSVKAAKGGVDGAWCGPPALGRFFKNGDLVACLHQGARAHHAGHACTNDGDGGAVRSWRFLPCRAGGDGCCCGGAGVSGPFGAGNGFWHGRPFGDRSAGRNSLISTHSTRPARDLSDIRNGGGFPAGHGAWWGFAADSATIAVRARAS